MKRELQAVERKQFIVEKMDSGAPADSNIARAMITAQVPDRMGDIVVATGAQLDNYLKNPVVLFGHDSGALPVGRATELAIHAGKGIEAAWEWSPLEAAQDVKLLWNLGFLNATSIGFQPLDATELETEDMSWWPPLQFDSWELLEFSVVPVPANQDALRLSLKGLESTDLLRLKAVLTKAGRVLSAANETNLKDARDLIDGVLQSAAPADTEEDGAKAGVATVQKDNAPAEPTVTGDSPDPELDLEPLITQAVDAATAAIELIIRNALVAAIALDEIEDVAEAAE